VQTTLLSAGIAIILALVAALVGPYYVPWENWRGSFESEVAALTGLEVRVAGPIQVRLLPTPTLELQDIALGRPGDPAKTRARALRVELALGDLMRGVWRASDMILQGPELTLGLDLTGRLAWSAPTIEIDPDTVAIEHLVIEDGRANFADAASGRRLSIEQVQFSGQVRSLVGPVRGEGSFVLDGRRYPFQLSASRPGDDGGVKVKLTLAGADHPPSYDVDGSIWVENGRPRFDGALQVVRPGSHDADGEPWRLSGHLRADGGAAVLQEMEFQYGPEDRAVHLKGNANVSLGAQRELSVTLSGPQLDLDQVLAVPETGDRRPLAAARHFAESLLAAAPLSMPARFAFTIDAVTLGGATLRGVGGDVSSDRDGWNIMDFSLRAPGLSQLTLSGQLSAARGGPSFKGGAKIESGDLQALTGWLTARADVPPAAGGRLHLESDIALSSDAIAFDRLDLGLDSTKIEGRLDLAWPADDRPMVVDADLRAPVLDVDRVLSLVQAGQDLTGLHVSTPALDVGRGAVGGTEAKNVAIKLRYDPTALAIERFVVADIGGASFSLKGRIDTREAAPRGALSLDLDAGSLDAVAAVAGKLSSPLAAWIRRAASRAVPLHLHSSLALDRDAAASKAAAAKLRLQGNAGVLRLDLQGDAADAVQSLGDIVRLGSGKVHVKGSVDANDGSALVEMLWLDRLVSVNQRSGWLKLDASGALDGDMAIAGELHAGGLQVSANGTLHPSGDQGPTGRISLDASAQDVVPLRFAWAGRAVQPPWSTLKADLVLAAGGVRLADLDGTLGGYAIKGNFGIALSVPPRLDGDISVAYLDLPAVIGAAVGFPHSSGSTGGAWPADPFEAGVLGSLDGRITINAEQVALTSKLAAHGLRAVVALDGADLALKEIDGALAGGRLRGDLGFTRGEAGVVAHGHLDLADVDAGELLGGGAAPLSGKLAAVLDLTGSGRSPVALIGSLAGKGSVALRDGGIARMNPGAFDIVARAVDRGLPIDAVRIGERMDAALSAAPLPTQLAEGTITVSMGQLRSADLKVLAGTDELAPSGSVDLTQNSIDARLLLSGPISDGPEGSHPNVTVNLKGPIDAPKRSVDVVALTQWLTLRAADQKAKRANALEQAQREHPDEDVETTGTPGDQDSTSTPSALPRSIMPPPRQRPAAAQRPAVEQAPLLPPPLDLRPPISHGPRG
jgi:large subunit ribosomal protein L24